MVITATLIIIILIIIIITPNYCVVKSRQFRYVCRQSKPLLTIRSEMTGSLRPVKRTFLTSLTGNLLRPFYNNVTSCTLVPRVLDKIADHMYSYSPDSQQQFSCRQ